MSRHDKDQENSGQTEETTLNLLQCSENLESRWGLWCWEGQGPHEHDCKGRGRSHRVREMEIHGNICRGERERWISRFLKSFGIDGWLSHPLYLPALRACVYVASRNSHSENALCNINKGFQNEPTGNRELCQSTGLTLGYKWLVSQEAKT